MIINEYKYDFKDTHLEMIASDMKKVAKYKSKIVDNKFPITKLKYAESKKEH